MKKEYNCECGYSTDNIFDLIRHESDVQIQWMVRLNDSYSFDIFSFLEALYNLDSLNDVRQLVQSTTTAFAASALGELDELVEESIVQQELSEIDEDLIKLLKEGTNE
jgi:hypothetical protein